MPKFSDQWVIDRTLFDFVDGGSSCACCGLPNLFVPDNVNDLITNMSDFETDAAQNEISALDKSPWPHEIKLQIWSDRFRLRQRLKLEMKEYKTFFNTHGTGFEDWLWASTTTTTKDADSSGLSPKQLRQVFQMPRGEVFEILATDYNIHGPYSTVMRTVTQQLVRFKDTGYPPDGRETSELDFEACLKFDRRGGFTLKQLTIAVPAPQDSETTTTTSGLQKQQRQVNKEVLEIWLKRMKSLGGPKLLERAPKVRKQQSDDDDDDEEEEEGDADDASPQAAGQEGPSFRSDRRLLRLFIARYWANVLIKKYTEFNKEKQQENNGEEEKEEQQVNDPERGNVAETAIPIAETSNATSNAASSPEPNNNNDRTTTNITTAASVASTAASSTTTSITAITTGTTSTPLFCAPIASEG